MFNESREGMFPSWLLWVIGPVTVIAAALIVFAVVLGIRAGQRQIETQRRQEVGIALQRAADYQAEGRLQEAVAEYRRVLMLDPGNETALTSIQSIVDQATGGVAATQPVSGSATATTTSATPAAGAVAAPVATTPPSAETQQLFDQARTVYGTGQWQQAVTLLLQLQQQAPDFQRTQVEEMLYNAYVNLAAAADQLNDLELAIEYVDKALALRPSSSALQAARAIAANYVEALKQEGVDWGRAVELYEAVYAQDPNYRDVSTRLNAARFAYGDQLALAKEWCLAEEQYNLALEISVPAGSVARRDDFTARCAQLQALRGGTPVPTSTRVAAVAGTPTVTPTPLPTSSLATTVDSGIVDVTTTPDALLSGDTITDTETPEVVETPAAAPVVAGPVGGRLLYAALDPVNGVSNIYMQAVGSPHPEILFFGGTQPSMRPDGQRFAFRNLNDDSRGISALDPATGLHLRFTTYSEDAYPSWNGLGNLIAFSSNREGDRRWRIYVVWADINNEATAITYGQYPDWHPSEDRIAFQGCDDSGNGCGIRSISGGGGDNRGITSVAADMQPDWSPTGQFLVFTSEARDGNPEIYRVDIASGQVTRLTDSGSIDAAPAVSPDGSWVAFLSNRSGAWAIWAVPSSGGEAQQLFTLEGNVSVWQDFKMHWLN
jgi:tetratricopeptide (TPR) repeat protein